MADKWYDVQFDLADTGLTLTVDSFVRASDKAAILPQPTLTSSHVARGLYTFKYDLNAITSIGGSSTDVIIGPGDIAILTIDGSASVTTAANRYPQINIRPDDNLATALTLLDTTIKTGTLSTTQATTRATQADNWFNNKLAVVYHSTGIFSTPITLYENTNGRFTFGETLPFTPSAGDRLTVLAIDLTTIYGVAGNVSGSVGSVTGAVGSVTGNVGGNVTGSVASVTGNVNGNVVGSVGSVVARVTANTDQWNGSAVATPNVSGVPIIDLKYTLGTLSPATAGSVRADAVTGAVGSVTGAVGSVTGNVGGNVTGSVGSVASGGITSSSFAASAITASAIATDAIDADALATDAVTEIVGGVYNATRASYTTVGSFGEGVSSVQGSVTGSVASVTGAVGSVTGAVGSVTGNVGGNVTGSVGSVLGGVGGSITGSVGSVTGSVGSVVGNVGGNIVGNVNGNVAGSVNSVTTRVTANTDQWSGSTVATPSVSGVPIIDLKYTLGTLSPAAAGSVRADAVTGAVGSVTGSVGSVTGAVGSVTGNVGGNVVGNVNGNVVGFVASVTGSVGSVASGGITTASFAAGAINAAAIGTGAIDADALATDAVTEIAGGVLDATQAGHLTAGTIGASINKAATKAERAQRLIEGRWKIDPGTYTLTLYDADGITILNVWDLTGPGGSPSVNIIRERVPQITPP